MKNGELLARHHGRVISEFIESVLDDLDLTDLERNVLGVAIRAEVEEKLVPGLYAVAALLLDADARVLGECLPAWLEQAQPFLPAEDEFLAEIGRRLDPAGAALMGGNSCLSSGESGLGYGRWRRWRPGLRNAVFADLVSDVSFSLLKEVVCLVDVLYKYMTAERVLTCLPEVGDGTLRATQPAALNDPFECAVRSLFVMDESEANREFARVLSSIHGTAPVTEDDVALARKQYGSLYLRNLFTRQVSQRFGIVAFASGPRHPLMWSHYTSDGSGFVVGYDVEYLRRLSAREGSLREVRYGHDMAMIIDYVVLGFPDDNLNGLLSLKSDHWSYESEWRLIVELDETIGTGLRDSRGLPINLVRVPNEAVVSVYHTERTPAGDVEEVRSRLENPNNRYGVQRLTNLVASAEHYGYEDASGQGA